MDRNFSFPIARSILQPVLRYLLPLVLLFGSLVTNTIAVEVYHVGNSITRALDVARIGAWALSRGHSYSPGQHVHNGASLNNIWEWHSPSESLLSPYGSYYEALPAVEWDAITLSPFFDEINTAAARIVDFSGLTSQSTQTYIYQAWPRYQWGDYAVNWNSFYQDGSTSMFMRDYYRKLLAVVSPDVKIIPTGEVLYEIDSRIKSGTLTNLNAVRDLYEVDLCTCHLNDVGNFVLATTVYATLFGESPIGLSHPNYISPEFATTIQQIVWQVIPNHVRTGLAPTGDFDGDGTISAMDYQRWKHNYHLGISDAVGYTAWRNALVELEPLAVPEPATAMQLVILVFLVGCCRRLNLTGREHEPTCSFLQSRQIQALSLNDLSIPASTSPIEPRSVASAR